MKSAPDELHRLTGERSRHLNEYRKVLAHRDDELDRLHNTLGPGSAKWSMLVEDRANAQAEYQAIAGQLGRPINRFEVAGAAFFALALLLAVAETPVNKFLFDVAIQGNNITSYVVSFAVAVFLLIVAHIAGRLTRQVWSEFKRKLYVANVILALVIMLFLLFVVSILTMGRAEFSAAALAGGLELFASLGQKVQSEGLVGALSTALADISALVLATVNITSILAAFLLGYFSHDSDKHFDKADEKSRAANRALERRDRAFRRRVDQAREQSRVKLDNVNSKYTAANAAIVTQRTARGLPVEEDDKFALTSLDQLLTNWRQRSEAAHEDGSAAQEWTGAPEHGPVPVDELAKVRANVARVPARDQK
jgi:hypothetical protein